MQELSARRFLEQQLCASAAVGLRSLSQTRVLRHLAMNLRPIRRILGLCAVLLMPLANAAEPSILEIRVMQSRIYESSAREFLLGLEEICKVRGAALNGFSSAGPKALSAEQSAESLARGNVGCVGYSSPELKGMGLLGTQFKIEGSAAGPNRIQVRIYARSFVSDGPNRTIQVNATDKQIYALIFKDISEAIGLKDIPIQVNRAE